MRGDPAAPVAVIVYSDFQCPFSARFATQVQPRLEELADGKLFLAFRHLPLETLHPAAFRAATAAECAREQDKFWEMHDLLFEHRQSLEDSKLLELADGIGLDPKKFAGCLDDVEVNQTLRRDVQKAGSYLINGTPTFLVGLSTGDGNVEVKRRFSGAVPVEFIQRVVDEVLAASSERTPGM